MKMLVLGAHGQAGHMISLFMTEQGHDVTGFDRTPVTHCRSIVGDARDKDALKKLIEQGGFDAVINCIGILNQFAENDRALAAFLNGYFPHFLASITKDLPTQIIHMSTDCVFSGEKGGYTETSLRDGRTFYDRSKALGELEDDKNVTLRNSIVGPDINPQGIGLLNWFMQQQGAVKGFRKAMWTGLTTLELAKAMEQAALQKAHGLYNMVYKQPISKYDLLCLFNEHLRKQPIEIIPADGSAIDKSLVRTRFDFAYEVPDYEAMVAELGVWMRAHRSYYPHYDV